MRPTYHLVPEMVWTAADESAPYRAASLDAEGFIHCTDGQTTLMETADRHYRSDPRSFLALTIDLAVAGSRWTIEDAAGIYPHVFGPIDRAAIIVVERLERSPDGAFIGLQTWDPDRTTPAA